MTSKEDLIQYAAHAASSPKVAMAVSGAAIGSGVSTYLELMSRGVAIATSFAGGLLAIALFRNAIAKHVNTKLLSERLRLEQREAELRIQVLERELSRNDMDSPLP